MAANLARQGDRISTDRAVYSAIRDRVVNFQFDPGTQINVEQLADALNVGRIAINEALIRLTEQNMLELVPGEGVYAKRPCLEESLMDYELLLTLSKAVYRKISKVPSNYVEPLSGFLESVPESKGADAAGSCEIAEKFLALVFSIAGNARYWKIGREAISRTHYIRTIDLELRHAEAAVASSLRRTAEALLQSEYQAARDLLLADYEASVRSLPEAHREALLRLHSSFRIPMPLAEKQTSRECEQPMDLSEPVN